MIGGNVNMARKRDIIEEILAKIEPYSVWPLNTSGDLFLIIVQGHPLFEDFKKQILGSKILKSKSWKHFQEIHN